MSDMRRVAMLHDRQNLYGGATSTEPDDPFWSDTLRQWNRVCWVLFAALSVGLAAIDRPGPARFWALCLLGAAVLSFAVVDRFPDNPILPPHAYLCVLCLALGGLSYLHNSYAAMFIVALPHFWLFARTLRASLAFTALATVSSLIGSWIRQRWSLEFLSSTLVSTLVVVAASVLIGLWLHAVLEKSRDRARLIAELEKTQAELSVAHQRQGAIEERERIARDIHDTLAQGLASIVVLAAAGLVEHTDDAGTTGQRLRAIENTARDNLVEARALVASGHSSHPENDTVVETLRRTLDRFAEDTDLDVVTDLADITCDQPTRIALLRCTQEALANVRKHADASTVSVVLAAQHSGVELEITDDGRGFVTGEPSGFGLNGMRKRLAELGGNLDLTSSLGDGTRILATIPTSAPETGQST